MNRSLVASPLSPRVSADPDGGRHAERRHPVEHVAPNFCLGALIGQSPGVKPPSNDALVAEHRGFNEAPFAITRVPLPFNSSGTFDRSEMRIPPRLSTFTHASGRSGRNDTICIGMTS